jgi:hypothetical protein
MLQKQIGNFQPSKLCAILLFEADFNQNNKLLGRTVMNYAEQQNGLALEQFGSRKQMSAIGQSLNKTLTFDLWRQFKTPGALCSNDAKSCYDLQCGKEVFQRPGALWFRKNLIGI